MSALAGARLDHLLDARVRRPTPAGVGFALLSDDDGDLPVEEIGLDGSIGFSGNSARRKTK